MTVSLETFASIGNRLPTRDIVAALRETLYRNHTKILDAARSDWEVRHGCEDPSDACATIRIATSAPVKKRVIAPARKLRCRS